jgi:hypothetical protein
MGRYYKEAIILIMIIEPEEQGTDIEIKVNGTTFKAKRFELISRSTVFRDMFLFSNPADKSVTISHVPQSTSDFGYFLDCLSDKRILPHRGFFNY